VFNLKGISSFNHCASNLLDSISYTVIKVFTSVKRFYVYSKEESLLPLSSLPSPGNGIFFNTKIFDNEKEFIFRKISLAVIADASIHFL